MEHFIGIDVAKDRLDVHIRPNSESFTLARDGEALAALVERLRGLDPAVMPPDMAQTLRFSLGARGGSVPGAVTARSILW